MGRSTVPEDALTQDGSGSGTGTGTTTTPGPPAGTVPAEGGGGSDLVPPSGVGSGSDVGAEAGSEVSGGSASGLTPGLIPTSDPSEESPVVAESVTPSPVVSIEGTPTSQAQTEQLFEDPEVLGRHQIGSETPTPDNYYDTITSDLDPRLRSFYGENSIGPLIVMGQRTEQEYDRRAAEGESLLQRATLADGTNLRGNPRIVDLLYLPVAVDRFEGVDGWRGLTELVATTSVLRPGEVDQYDTDSFQAFIDQQSDTQLLALSQSVLPAMAARFYGLAYGYSEDQLQAMSAATGRSVEYLNQQGYPRANIIDHGGFGGTEVAPVDRETRALYREVVPADVDLARMWTEGVQGTGSMRQGFSTAHNLLRAEIARREAAQNRALEEARSSADPDPRPPAEQAVAEDRVEQLGVAEQIYSGTAAQAPAEASLQARAERAMEEDYRRIVPDFGLTSVSGGGIGISASPGYISAPGRMNQRDLDPRDAETNEPISYSSSDTTRPHVALVARRIAEMRGETADDGSPLHTEEDIRSFAYRMGSSSQEVQIYDQLLVSEYTYLRARVSGDEVEGDLEVSNRERNLTTLRSNIERYQSEIEALEASRASVSGDRVEAAAEQLEINRQIRARQGHIEATRAMIETREAYSRRAIPGEVGTFRTYTGINQQEGESRQDYLMRVAERRVVLMLNIAQTANLIDTFNDTIGDSTNLTKPGMDYIQGLQQEFSAVPEGHEAGVFDAIRRYEDHSWSTLSARANTTAYNNIYDRHGFVPPPRPTEPDMPPRFRLVWVDGVRMRDDSVNPHYTNWFAVQPSPSAPEGLPHWSHGDGRHWVAQAQDLVWNSDLSFGQATADDPEGANPRRGYWVTREQDAVLRGAYANIDVVNRLPATVEQLEERRRLQLLQLQGVGGQRQ